MSLDEQEKRLRLADEMVGRLQSQLHDRLLAVAAYGSVAHGAADGDSDLELSVLADPSVKPVTVHLIAEVTRSNAMSCRWNAC